MLVFLAAVAATAAIAWSVVSWTRDGGAAVAESGSALSQGKSLENSLPPRNSELNLGLEKKSVPLAPPLFETLSATSVVVRIDGREIAKSQVLRDAKSLMQLMMNKLRVTKMGRRERLIFAHSCRQSVPLALNAAAVARYAEQNGVEVSSNVLAYSTSDFTRRFGVRSKKLKRWHTVGDLKYMLGSNAGYVDRLISEHARLVAVTNAIVTAHPIEVTDALVEERLKLISKSNLEAAKTNALIFVQATNLWKQIASGAMSFDVAATNYSQDAYIADSAEWGSFSLDQIADDPQLFALVPTLGPGDITPPIESDNGLAIVRVDEQSVDKKTYTFSRIFFRLPMFFEEETPEEARANVKGELETELVRKTLEAERAKLKVEYPSGEPLFAEGSAPLSIKKGDLNQ